MINFTDEEETEIEKAFIALKQALAEKDREYQHLMAQAIRFAQYYDNAGVDVERLKEVQAFLKEHP